MTLNKRKVQEPHVKEIEENKRQSEEEEEEEEEGRRSSSSSFRCNWLGEQTAGLPGAPAYLAFTTLPRLPSQHSATLGLPVITSHTWMT